MEAVATDFGIKDALKQLGVKELNEGTSTGTQNFANGDIIESYSPVDGQLIAKVKSTTRADYDQVMYAATSAFKIWRDVPAPQRGDLPAHVPPQDRGN